MNKEELIALGLSDEQADAVVGKYVNMIPKSRLDEVIEQKNLLQAAVDKGAADLEVLKASSDSSEALKAQITELQAANETAKQEFEASLKETRLNSELKLALNGKVHDFDYVSTLLDKSQFVFKEDGSVDLTALQPQLDTLKETKGFAFVQEAAAPTQQIGGWKPAETTATAPQPLDIGTQFAQALNKGVNVSSVPVDSPWA